MNTHYPEWHKGWWWTRYYDLIIEKCGDLVFGFKIKPKIYGAQTINIQTGQTVSILLFFNFKKAQQFDLCHLLYLFIYPLYFVLSSYKCDYFRMLRFTAMWWSVMSLRFKIMLPRLDLDWQQDSILKPSLVGTI